MTASGSAARLPRTRHSGGSIARDVRGRRITCLAAIALIATACDGASQPAANAGDPAVDTLLQARVDALVAPLVEAREFSGAIVLMREGASVYQRGFGMANHEVGVRFTPDTPSDGGSIAKTFTAAGVWLLVHEGRLDIDAPVTRYLPEFPHAATTVRHLIAHSNGLPPYYEFFEPYFGADEVRTTLGLLRIIRQQAPRPRFVPGSRFEYSNPGYDAAALVIERVSGERFEDFVASRFFAPLEMRASFGRPARFRDWPTLRTRGYRWAGSAWEDWDVADREAFLGASNLYFSAADLARWGHANATGAALPAAAASAGQAYIALAGGRSGITGLSWYCDATQSRCHYTGDYNGFYSFVYWDRVATASIAFVSNSGLPWWKRIGLQRALVAALDGRVSAIDDTRGLERFGPSDRARIAGSFRAEPLGTVSVAAAPDGLTFRVGSGLSFAMFPVDDAVFYVPGLDYVVAFSGGQPPTRVHIRSVELDLIGERQ